ncbi:MAG: hypothetical protein EBZ36_18040, partial [Acidobacteria bacterium]|nr:hypothetical protein [Acidobacteriota bacterium]
VNEDYRLAYVRSRDMVNWTDAFDRPISLPIRPNTAPESIVDNIPKNNGLHRSNPRSTFDRQGNPIIAYHKYDAGGKSQIYVAKPDPATQAWKVVQLTNSTVRWDLVTAGSASNSFLDDDPLDGLVTLQISLVGSDGTAYPGNGYYTLDENTLETTPDMLDSGAELPFLSAALQKSSAAGSSGSENMMNRCDKTGFPMCNTQKRIEKPEAPRRSVAVLTP